ncbi:MAG: ORF6N domain-containing protein [Bacteroidales bacterium]|nr:ORF6N domain-containing protein [Bacteroidales bacterium]
MTQIEFDEHQESLRLQIETSKEKRGGRRYLPYVFTEQGVSMLSAVLRSETAIKVSIQIIDAFVEMRKFISQNAKLFLRINNIEQKLIASDIKQLETNNKIDAILDALEDKSVKPNQGIFYDGQVLMLMFLWQTLLKKPKFQFY